MRQKERTSGGRARRRASRRPSVWRNIAHTGMRIGLYMLALAMLAAVANKVWHPIGLKRTLQKDVATTRTDLSGVQAENDALRRRMRYLETPEGIQAEARKLGYINKGEVPLRLQEPPKPKETKETGD